VPCTPSITAVGTTPERITHLVEVAHRQCYIANSLATPVRIEPTITIAAELMGAPAAGSSGSP
jgi:organic hydroperoxide reductase OsmC/OhrA